MRILLSLTALSLLVPAVAAQTYFGVGADFGAIIRQGGWSQTYGPALVSGVRAEAWTARGWLGGLQAEVLYGRDVRVDPIAGLRTRLGLLGDAGAAAGPAAVELRSRGYRLAALAGYRHDLGDGPVGIRVLFGPAYTVHQIRLQDDADLATSNLTDDLKAGYDRRAGGLGAYAEAGVSYARDGGGFVAFVSTTLNAFAARPLRSVQFDLRRAAPEAGTDVALGLKAGFVTALFGATSREDADDLYY